MENSKIIVINSKFIKFSGILPKGEYKATGCPSDGGNGKYRIAIGYTNTDGSYSAYGMDDGNGFEFEVTDETRPMQVQLIVYNGYTANNLVFKPMIRLASITDDTYEPYVGGIPAPSPEYPQKITISGAEYDSVAVTLESGDKTESCGFALRTDGLAGIPVDSGGNYTDENGQQWICDEIVKYTDGTGKRIQRIGMKIIESSTVIALTNQSEDGVCTFSTVPYWLSDRLNSVNAKGMCDKLIFGGNHYNGSQIIASGDGKMCFINSTAYNTVYFNTSKATTVQEFHSLFDGMKIYYILAEPIETDLTTSELKVYENLQTFYPATNISNNANCGMSITYVADTKNYIDNKIASLEKALYNNI